MGLHLSASDNKNGKKQEDFEGITQLQNEIKNPEEFIRDEINKAVEEHKDSEDGSTIVAHYFDPKTDKITVGSLGDSNLSVVFKYKDKITNEIKFYTVSITRGHNPQEAPDDIEKLREFDYQTDGTYVYNEKVENIKNYKRDEAAGTLPEGAARAGMTRSIGDAKLPHLIRTPEINTFEIWNLLPDGVSMDDCQGFDIIPGSDGLLENKEMERHCDAVIKVDENGKCIKKPNGKYEVEKVQNENEVGFFSYWAEEFYRKSPLEPLNAEYFVKESINKNGSKDNISAQVISVTPNTMVHKTMRRNLKPVFGVLCDGHHGERVAESCVKSIMVNCRSATMENNKKTIDRRGR